MLSQITMEEFADKLYPPVHGFRSIQSKGLITRLKKVGIDNLKTLIHLKPEELLMMKNIGPVFVSQTNLLLSKIGCHLGMTDAELKELLLSKL